MVICPQCGEDEALTAWPARADGYRPTACEGCGREWVREPAPDWRRGRDPRAVLVDPDDLDLDAWRALAIEMADEMRTMGSVESISDLRRRFGIGLLGEFAVAFHLAQLTLAVRSIGALWAEIVAKHGDLEVRPPHTGPDGPVVRLEIKTAGRVTWDRRGPVRLGASNSDAVVYCVIDTKNTQWVWLMGWLPTPDALAARYAPELRPMADLVEWIHSEWEQSGA